MSRKNTSQLQKLSISIWAKKKQTEKIIIQKKNNYLCRLTRGGVNIMLIIPIKDGENIDRALKRYKRKFDKTGVVRQLRKRQAFIKPSVINRAMIQKAAYVQNMREGLENM